MQSNILSERVMKTFFWFFNSLKCAIVDYTAQLPLSFHKKRGIIERTTKPNFFFVE